MSSEPSPLFEQFLPALREASRRGPVLDLACGRGRHALAAAERGIPVVALDRNACFLAELQAAAARRQLPVTLVRTDLETGLGLPVRPGSCGAILVFRFLFRPLAPDICAALTAGGLLLYETFTIRQRDLGYGPGNPDFLLRDGELRTTQTNVVQR